MSSVNLRCGFIKDKATANAVIFAVTLIRKGIAPGLAIHKAGKHYEVKAKTVAHYVGKHANPGVWL